MQINLLILITLIMACAAQVNPPPIYDDPNHPGLPIPKGNKYWIFLKLFPNIMIYNINKA